MICNQFHLLDKRQRLERRIAHRLAFCSHHHHRIEPTRTSQDCQSRLLDPLDILRRNLQIKRISLNPKPRTPLQRPVAPLHDLTPRLAIQVQSVPILPRLRLHSRKQHHTYYIINTLCLHLPFSSPSPFVPLFTIPLRSCGSHVWLPPFVTVAAVPARSSGSHPWLPFLPLSRYSAPAVRGIEGVRRTRGGLSPPAPSHTPRCPPAFP